VCVLGEFGRFYGGFEERGERERLVWKREGGDRRQATVSIVFGGL